MNGSLGQTLVKGGKRREGHTSDHAFFDDFVERYSAVVIPNHVRGEYQEHEVFADKGRRLKGKRTSTNQSPRFLGITRYLCNDRPRTHGEKGYGEALKTMRG
jgi:hypothetical protein